MAAATQTVPELLTLDEYLRTSYHPDCDSVDDPRLQEFLAMGVEHVWLLDPADRVAYTLTSAAGLIPFEGTRLTVPSTPIYLDLPEIFSALD